MMKDYFNRKIENKGNYDIIVAGGGVAGAAAALAAARYGKKVLLTEKSVLLGGLATNGLISWYEPICNQLGKKMIGGIAEEFLWLSIKYGFDNLADCWQEGLWDIEGKERYATLFSPTIFALALTDLLLSSGVTIRLDTLVTHPVMENQKCKGIIAESKSGAEFFGAKVVIDSTGDADLLHRAGLPCKTGQNFLSYVAHFSYFNENDNNKNALNSRRWVNPLSDLYGRGHPEGMKFFEGVSGDEVTEFILEGQKRMFLHIKDQDRNSRDISTLPTMAQFRKTRHLCGEYELTVKDLYKSHSDSIGRAGDFRKKGHWYEIPYRTLYTKKADNMLAAGRIISASDDGWEVARVIPVAVLTGQAAGTAACVSIDSERAVSDIDVSILQNLLCKDGIKLHFED